jgi:hypothetical protein
MIFMTQQRKEVNFSVKETANCTAVVADGESPGRQRLGGAARISYASGPTGHTWDPTLDPETAALTRAARPTLDPESTALTRAARPTLDPEAASIARAAGPTPDSEVAARIGHT